jgi:outer membrane protein OmpA-like peptidoglycan-associated protein
VLEAGEGCDDGGTAAGDKCTVTCKIAEGNPCNADAAGAAGDESCASGICDTTAGPPGTCVEGTDTDGDGVFDDADLDDDDDGILDAAEGDGSVDTDGDKVPDSRDLDSDNDGIPDATEAGHAFVDTDGDGLLDCPGDVGKNGVCDALETAAESGMTNYGAPRDTDGDGVADFRDLDADNDGLSDLVEGGAGCADVDNDAVCDGPDGDGDGIADDLDGSTQFGDDKGQLPTDTDMDGLPDNRDLESDGDDILDVEEGGNEELDGNGDGVIDQATDADGDGIIDVADAQPTTFGGARNPGLDTDEDDKPDFQDLDADGDGFEDNLGASGGGCAVGAAGGRTASGSWVLILGVLLLFGWRRQRALIVLAVLSWPVPALAQAQVMESGRYPVERMRLATDGLGILNVERGAVDGHLAWNMGLWVGGSNDPLVLYRRDEEMRVGSLIAYRVGGSVMGSVTLWERAAISAELPFVIYQGRSSTVDGVSPDLTGLSTGGLTDLRLVPKIAAMRRAGHALDVAFLPTVTVPMGGADDYFREGGVTFAPELAVSRSAGSLRVAANLGYHFRPRTQFLNLIVDDEIFARAGVAIELEDQLALPLEVALSVSGATAADDPLGRFNRTYLETMGALTYLLKSQPYSAMLAAGTGLNEGLGAPDWRVLLAGRYEPQRGDLDGDGLVGSADQCPTAAEDRDEFQDSDGCPEVDNDDDGVPDDRDGAPLDPEDRDGFADSDGVPDPDNDGDGIRDAEDRCPLEAEVTNGVADDDGCPDEARDTDGDGVRDDTDRCVVDAEDKDGRKDEDGCPDLDDDGDGVADDVDACPLEAGVADNRGCPDTDRDQDLVVDRLDNCPDEAGTQDNQGCRGKQLAVIKAGKIEILEIVYFQQGKDVILARSHALLDNVASVVVAHAEITRVEVEGHTDAVGDDQRNLNLSQRRAESVVRYLIARGVSADRLEARGYGETKPIASNATREGRGANRRVEFVMSRGAGDGIQMEMKGPTEETLEKAP